MQIQTIKNSIYNSATYIIYDDVLKYAFLIDCGDSDKILKFINEKGLVIKGIFITHCHYDHIYGLNAIFENNKDITIYASEETIKGLYDNKINLSLYMETPYICNKEIKTEIVTEDKCINTYNLNIYIINTPGHDAGCTTYIINNCIFTGDSFIPDTKVFSKTKRGNKELASRSIEKITDLIDKNNYKLYPGHI